MEDSEFIGTEPITVPPEYRKQLIRQILKGVITVSDFPELFPRIRRVIITLPPEPPDMETWEKTHVINPM